MKIPKTLIFSGYGLNCEEETQFGFRMAGARADIVHINDCIDRPGIFDRYQILALPGGFSYGDDTGSGNAYANKLKNHLWESVIRFIQKDRLVIGICNGFQILVNLGLLSGLNQRYGTKDIALLPNASSRLIDRWTDLKNFSSSPWMANITTISLPIGHGEGRLYAKQETIRLMRKKGMIGQKRPASLLRNMTGGKLQILN